MFRHFSSSPRSPSAYSRRLRTRPNPALTLTLALFLIELRRGQVVATFTNKDVEGASLWFDGKQQWMDGDWKVGHVRKPRVVLSRRWPRKKHEVL